MKKYLAVFLSTVLCLICLGMTPCHAAGAAIARLMIDQDEYTSGETIAVELLHFPPGAVRVEITWRETGEVVFWTDTQSRSLSVRSVLQPGSYMIKASQTVTSDTKFFSIAPSELTPYSLKSGLLLDDEEHLIGVRLEWTPDGSGPFTVTRVDSNGDLVTYEQIDITHMIDVNVVPNKKYSYRVSDGSRESNLVNIDLAEFTLSEYADSENINLIELFIADPYMYVNGRRKPIVPGALDVVPSIESGYTLLPVASIVQEMGGIVTWDGTQQLVTIKAWDKLLEIQIGNKEITIDGKKITYDVPAQIKSNRTMVPIRALETLGCSVDWIDEVRSVLIRYPALPEGA